VKLQLWDTAGQERFRTITSSYYRGSEGIMIVYDVTDEKSFDAVETWMHEINNFQQQQQQPNDNPPIILLVGNKCDLAKEVKTETVKKYVEQQDSLIFVETSAKTKQGVDEAFEMLAKKILEQRNTKERKKNSNTVTLSAGKGNVKEKKGCNI